MTDMADIAEPPAKKKCLGADCDNDAGSLQCPTCLKLGLKGSFFCSQDCFKRNWVGALLPFILPYSARGLAAQMWWTDMRVDS
jgi:hypothetical protein